MENGWVRADAFISRTGVFTYRNADGTTRREYRPPEEVFKADALESFVAVPLTLDHPPEGMLTADNTKNYQVGAVEGPRPDGAFVRSRVRVTDSAAIAALDSGKVQLSCGYLADLEEVSGQTPSGERFDAIQRNIRGNHVAIVAVGRAGPDVKVRMDSTDAIMVVSDSSSDSCRNRPSISEGPMAVKVKFDSVEVEVSEDVAKAIESERAAHMKALSESAGASKSEIEKLTARADVAEAEAKRLQGELASAPDKVRAEIKARMELEAKVKSVGVEFKADASDEDLRKSFIKARLPEMNLDGKDASYIAVAFDLAQARKAELETAPVPHADSALKKARADYFASLPK